MVPRPRSPFYLPPPTENQFAHYRRNHVSNVSHGVEYVKVAELACGRRGRMKAVKIALVIGVLAPLAAVLEVNFHAVDFHAVHFHAERRWSD